MLEVLHFMDILMGSYSVCLIPVPGSKTILSYAMARQLAETFVEPEDELPLSKKRDPDSSVCQQEKVVHTVRHAFPQ
jgi:hypothetical protein